MNCRKADDAGLKRATASDAAIVMAAIATRQSSVGVGLHAFRHGLGTALADNQESVKNIQKILRHSDIKSTLRYINPNTDTQRRALESLQSVQFGD
jgi:integrase